MQLQSMHLRSGSFFAPFFPVLFLGGGRISINEAEHDVEQNNFAFLLRFDVPQFRHVVRFSSYVSDLWSTSEHLEEQYLRIDFLEVNLIPQFLHFFVNGIES